MCIQDEKEGAQSESLSFVVEEVRVWGELEVESGEEIPSPEKRQRSKEGVDMFGRKWTTDRYNNKTLPKVELQGTPEL